jgi:phage-related protein
MPTFTYAVDWSPQAEIAPRVLEAKFGDGYQQRTADGINTSQRMFQLQFKNRSDTERDAIIAFLEARNGVESFDWTPPVGSAGKWVCKHWTESPTQVDRNTITAKFEEVHE